MQQVLDPSETRRVQSQILFMMIGLPIVFQTLLKLEGYSHQSRRRFGISKKKFQTLLNLEGYSHMQVSSHFWQARKVLDPSEPRRVQSRSSSEARINKGIPDTISEVFHRIFRHLSYLDMELCNFTILSHLFIILFPFHCLILPSFLSKRKVLSL